MKKIPIFLLLFVFRSLALTGWTDPLPVTAAVGDIQDFTFSISSDKGAGLFSYACNGGSAVNGIYLKTSFPGELSWSQNVLLSTENNDALSPSVSGLNNNIYSAWLDDNQGVYRVLFRRGREDAVELSSGGNCTSVKLFAGTGSCVHTAWAEGGVIFYRKGFNNGSNWSDLKTVGASPSDKPFIFEANGRLLLLWQGGSPAAVNYSVSTDGGNTWSAESNISSFGIASLAGAVDMSGVVYAVWEQANKIFFRKYGLIGWEMEKTVSTNTSGIAKYPAVAADADGIIYVFWTDNRSGGYKLYNSLSVDLGMTFTAETELASLPAAEKITAGSYKNNLHLFWKESGQVYSRVKDTAAPSPAKIASPTHTPAGGGSNNNCPVFTIIAEDNEGGTGIKGLSYIFDREPATVPETAINFTGNTLCFPKTANGKWYLHVKTADFLGNWSSTVHFTVMINNVSLLPGGEAWCFPNPVRSGEPKIRYFVPEDAGVELAVFNEAGDMVVSRTKEAKTGINEIADLDTSGWANGVYFCKIRANSRITGNKAEIVKKLVLMR